MAEFPSSSKLPRSEITRATRHVFLCVGPDCCQPADGAALWEILKAETRNIAVLRTKAACLRICTGGPWLVVYPDGLWYGALDTDRLRRIIREHLVDGRPVRELLAAEMPALASCAKKAGHGAPIPSYENPPP